MATCISSRADELAAIDNEAFQCVRAVGVDDFHYDRGQAAIVAQSNGAVHVPWNDDEREPVQLELRINDVLTVDEDESPLSVLINWYASGLDALLKLKKARGAN